jgi:hypothetical protein
MLAEVVVDRVCNGPYQPCVRISDVEEWTSTYAEVSKGGVSFHQIRSLRRKPALLISR